MSSSVFPRDVFRSPPRPRRLNHFEPIWRDKPQQVQTHQHGDGAWNRLVPLAFVVSDTLAWVLGLIANGAAKL